MLKSLEEDDAFPPEAASEENQDGTRDERRSRLIWALGLADL